MVTLNILQLLENEGIGTIAVNGWTSAIGNNGLYWEEMPIKPDGKDAQGIWIVSRSDAISRTNIGYQPFDIYARFASKVTGKSKLDAIVKILQESYADVCELPLVSNVDTPLYTNVRIQPTSQVENLGLDAINNVVWVMSGEVRYDEA